MHKFFGKSIIRRNRLMHWGLLIGLTVFSLVLAWISDVAKGLMK